MKKSTKRSQWLLVFVLTIYSISLLWLLFGMRITPGQMPDRSLPMEMRINLQPFRTVMRYVNEIRYSPDFTDKFIAFYNLGGNLGMFIPLGFLLPKILAPLRKFWKLLLFITVTMILVELLQFATYLGTCDIDDLLLNVAGTVMGWGIWRIKSK